MENVIDAINELIKTANVAQSRGVFSLKEAHDAYKAIEFITASVNTAAATKAEPAKSEASNSTY